MTVRTEHDPEVDASYVYLFGGDIACTAEARPDILVDLAADRTVLGIEVIGDASWTDGLVALAMAGRLRVAPASSC